MTRSELQVLRTATAKMLCDLNAIAVKCPTCRHFDGGTCGVAQAVPPPEVKASGCDAWEYDGIPI